MAKRWPDLTVQVMKIGYGNDLAYYYLCQAAQGLGYHQSAIAYYNYALALTSGSNALIRCAAGRVPGNDPCQGIDIATAIPALIDSSRQILEQQAAEKEAANAPAHVVHHHHKKAAGNHRHRRRSTPKRRNRRQSSPQAIPPQRRHCPQMPRRRLPRSTSRHTSSRSSSFATAPPMPPPRWPVHSSIPCRPAIDGWRLDHRHDGGRPGSLHPRG